MSTTDSRFRTPLLALSVVAAMLALSGCSDETVQTPGAASDHSPVAPAAPDDDVAGGADSEPLDPALDGDAELPEEGAEAAPSDEETAAARPADRDPAEKPASTEKPAASEDPCKKLSDSLPKPPVVVAEPEPVATPAPGTPAPTTPAPTTPVAVPPASSEGFTAITASADTRTIYVSSSTGDDGNNCLTAQTPCRTLDAAARLMRAGYPDHLYLKAGDTWRNEGLDRVRSGRSASEPAVVASYGTGARPVLETTGSRVLAFNTKSQGLLSHVRFIGLEFDNVRLDAAHPEYSGKKSDSSTAIFLGAHRDILLEDNRFTHMELVVQDWDTGSPTDFVIRRNIFTGAYVDTSSYSQDSRPSNIYAAGTNGLLIEENVFDHGGWHPTAKGAGANMYNHNLYLQHNNNGQRLVVRNNIVTRASSHGIQARAGGIVDDNFFARNAISVLIGYTADKPLKAGTPAQAHDNVISEGHSMIKGHDHCKGVNLCTAALWGLELSNPGTAQASFRNNIVSSAAPGDTLWTARYKNLSSAALKIHPGALGTFSSNIVWQWPRSTDVGPGGYPDPGRTLGSYYDSLVAKGVPQTLVSSGYLLKAQPAPTSFDGFMNIVLNRAPKTWDERFTAYGINQYIRAGYSLPEAVPGH